jgi:heme/copper-type cytochrome/quinol oxidase subunit 2
MTLPNWKRLATLTSLALMGLTACRQTPRPDQLTLEMTGHDFTWETRYPGPDLVLHTEDDVFGGRDVHVPADTRVDIQLRSRDYIYVLVLPHIDQREIAVPDLEFSLVFESRAPAQHDLRGNQMCGDDHPLLLGTLTVQSWGSFDDWMENEGIDEQALDERTP